MIALAMLTGHAYAQVSLNENSDTRVITASGSVDGTKMTNLISLNIVDDEGSEVYSAVIPTANGEINYSFKLPDKSGKYQISFTGYNGEPTVIEYEYLSKADIETILTGINNAADESAVIAVLDGNVTALGLNGNWYKNLSSDGKNKIAKAILTGRADGYTSLETIKNIAREQLATAAAAEITDGDSLAAAYAEFNDIYKLETNTKLYEEYTKLSEAGKKNADEIAAAAGSDTLEALYKNFDEAAFLAMINASKQPADVTDIIDKHGNDVSFSNDNYSKADKTLLAKYIYSKGGLKTLAELSDAIDEGYKYQTKKPTGGNGGGGSSSGGGSGSKKNTGSSIVSTVTNPDPEKKDPEPVYAFEDMKNAAWANEAVTYLSDKKIVSGVDEKNFAPYSKVTREQFASMIVKAFDMTDSSAESDFDDLPDSHWAYRAVSAAYQKRIVSGMSEKMFGTGNNIKRCDIAVMAANAAKAAGVELKSVKDVSFTDFEDVPEYARESVRLMAAAGIINGYDDGSFKPLDNATRAEAAQIIYTIIK